MPSCPVLMSYVLFAGYDVRIVNNMGKEVARGEQGNIGVKVKPVPPPGLFKGTVESQYECAVPVFWDSLSLTPDSSDNSSLW